MSPLSLSVALATYNGARYLPDQLQSFLTQSRPPDELVACDDDSTDRTPDLLDEFARNAPFPVTVHRNEERLGPRGNFNQAIGFCSGDLIALSDQDDVWLPGKLERLAGAAEADTSALVVVHDLALVDDALRSTGVTMLQRMNRLRIPATNLVTGSGTLLRAEIVPILLPIPEAVRIYDEWIHLVGRALGGRRLVPEVLSLYRRHNQTETHAAAASWTSRGLASAIRASLLRPSDIVDGRRMELLRELEARLDSLDQSFWPLHPTTSPEGAQAFIKHQRRAVAMRENAVAPRWPVRWLRVMAAYRAGIYEEFAGPGSAIRDLTGSTPNHLVES